MQKMIITKENRAVFYGQWVYVSSYTRVRNGQKEYVRPHVRKWPGVIPTIPKPAIG